ncbi:MAG TPA: SurA N-terminal domain-containing protein [Devosia sp.]|mgnify:CR=1 FL=1|nr:SurA N-terminal domain-containing protein [Devosia sp.]
MLNSLRHISRTWWGRVLFVLLLIGLTGFGVSGVILDFGSSTVAHVGGEEISAREFQRAYNDDLNRAAQQIGQMPSPEQALAMGVPSSTLNRLASEAAINQLAENMGVGVSDDRLSQMLRQDPTFSGTLGNFERENFVRVLQQLGYTEAEYFDLQKRASRRQQISAGLFADSPVPKAAEELLAGFTGDKRTIDYFVLNAQSIPPVAEPTEEELAAFLKEHQAEHRTVEKRTADLLVLSLATLGATMEVSDEEIAAEYERTRESRAAAEKRTIRQAPLTTEQATAFEAGKAAGKTFDQLVTETGVTVSDLGTLAKPEVLDPALATAAFGLAAGDFAIIPGIGGQRAINVSAIQEGSETSLDAVREELRASLGQKKARDTYTDILDQVEELRAALRPLPEIAERFGLELKTVTLSSSGAEFADVPSVAADARGRVASAIFDAEVGELPTTISLSANNNIWFDLKAIDPARDQTLDEVRDAVATAITEERTSAAVTTEVEAIVESLKGGLPFADVALQRNQFPILSQPMTRNGDGTPVLSRSVASAAFAGGTGHFGSAINDDGDNVIFQVVEIIPAEASSLEQAQAYLQETTRQSLYADFVTGLRDAAGVKLNQKVLDQILVIDPVAGQ